MTNGNTPPNQQPSYEVPPQPGYQQQGNQQQGYQQQGYAYQQPPVMPTRQGWGSVKKDKWVAALLAWLLGALGIHKFYLGYKNEGLIMLAGSIIGAICTFGLATLVFAIIAVVEAVKYVILTQEDFERIYVYGNKPWF